MYPHLQMSSKVKLATTTLTVSSPASFSLTQFKQNHKTPRRKQYVSRAPLSSLHETCAAPRVEKQVVEVVTAKETVAEVTNKTWLEEQLHRDSSQNQVM